MSQTQNVAPPGRFRRSLCSAASDHFSLFLPYLYVIVRYVASNKGKS